MKEAFQFVPTMSQAVYEYEMASDIKPVSSMNAEAVRNNDAEADDNASLCSCL